MVDPTWTPENERDLAELETAAQSIIDKWTGPLPAVVCALTEKAEALQAQVKYLEAQNDEWREDLQASEDRFEALQVQVRPLFARLPADATSAMRDRVKTLQAQVKALQAQVKALLEPAANLQVEYLNLAGALSRLLLAVTLAPQAPMREWHVNNALKGANRALDDAQEVMEDEAFVY